MERNISSWRERCPQSAVQMVEFQPSTSQGRGQMGLHCREAAVNSAQNIAVFLGDKIDPLKESWDLVKNVRLKFFFSIQVY